jgi:hypothetical protein
VSVQGATMAVGLEIDPEHEPGLMAFEIDEVEGGG